MKELAVPVIAVASTVLWTGVVAPIIARVVGVPMRIGFWGQARKNEHLTEAQFVWAYGVFAFGGGLFLLFRLMDYLQRTLLSDQLSRPSARRVAVQIAAACALGLVCGLVNVRHHNAPPKAEKTPLT
jgi:hypothetical protein